jgi:DNA mismatch repair ATPase MutS
MKLESLLFQNACDDIKAETKSISRISNAMAELDVSSSFALFAQQNGYCRPQMTSEYSQIMVDVFIVFKVADIQVYKVLTVSCRVSPEQPW